MQVFIPRKKSVTKTILLISLKKTCQNESKDIKTLAKVETLHLLLHIKARKD